MKSDKIEIVVAAARTLFSRFGYNKTTVDDIARESFVAKSTVYNYFNSKEEIFDAVIEKEGGILFHEINKAIEDISDPYEMLRVYAKTRMLHVKQLRNLYYVLTDDYLMHHSFIDKARNKSLEREIKVIAGILKQGVDGGFFKVKDLNLTSFLIITAWKGLDIPWTVDVELPDPYESVDYIIEMLFNGIRER